MADLSSSFAGVKLRNPLIVAASSLTGNISGIRKMADNGAGAVVIKSLFQEQIAHGLQAETNRLDSSSHPEASDYIAQMGMHAGAAEYLTLVAEAKKSVDIPVFASVNCVELQWWQEFSTQLSSAGADGLELNIGFMPTDPLQDAATIEAKILGIVGLVKKHTSLPLVVKLGNAFTNIGSISAALVKLGVKGLVFFNRFYQLDINLEKLQPKAGLVFSNPNDYYQSLRWISLLHCKVDTDYAAAGGIHDGKAALRCILAGAPAIQICSTVFKNGPGVIKQMLAEMEAWMNEKSYKRIADFRGLLCQAQSEQPADYERVQYIKALTGIS